MNHGNQRVDESGRVDLSNLIPGNVPDEVLQGAPAYAQLKAALERALSDFAARPDKAESKAALLEATEKADAYRKAVAALRPSEPTAPTTGKIPEKEANPPRAKGVSNRSLSDRK